MSTVEKCVTLSPEEYLEGEKHADVKHEYAAGHVYAMVGVSRAHNLISLNLASTLQSHLRGKPCQVFMADVKVRVADAFYYPDVMVDCQRGDPARHYTQTPILIIEVLSPSTEARDGFEKRIAYQALDSLREYVLVAQDKIEVQIYRRRDDGWNLETCSENDQVNLSSVELQMPIEAIYEEVWR